MPRKKEISEVDMKFIKSMIEDKVKHFESSPETKRAIDNLKEDVAIIREKQAKHDEQISNRVTYKIFIWVVGLLVSLFVSLSAYIVNQIHDLQEKTYDIKSDVAKITGTLENLDFKIIK